MSLLTLRAALVAVLTLGPSATLAENWALVFGDTGQLRPLQGDAAAGADAYIQPLRAAGFEVIQPKTRSAEHMRQAAQVIERELAKNAIDRLVIVATGPMAGRSGDSWLMSNDTTGASAISIGASGISLSTLSDMASRANSRAVVLLAPGQIVSDLGTGLQPGLQGYERAANVTYITGPGRDLVRVLAGALLEPGTSFAQAARAAPDSLRFSGNISPNAGLLDVPPVVPLGGSEEDGYWKAVRQIDTVAAYQAYLTAYPNGRYRDLATNAQTQRAETPAQRAERREEALKLSREARREIQRDLTLLGYDTRGIDGIFGSGTRAAIAKWQGDHDIAANGFLSRGQIDRLDQLAGIRARELEAEAAARRAEELARDKAYWRDTGQGSDEAGLRAYLDEFPDGEFSDLASERLAAIEDAQRGEADRRESAAWDEAQETDTKAGYQAFLRDYPDGTFAEAAKTRISDIEKRARIAAALDQARAEEGKVAGTRVARHLVEGRLKSLGLNPGDVDGKFTKQTRKAIRQFQRGQDLLPTGYVTRATMVRLLAL